jgi:hypothetical protein
MEIDFLPNGFKKKCGVNIITFIFHKKNTKKLTKLQQTNNIKLTVLQSIIYNLCSVINWLFIILVLVSYENADSSRVVGIF